MPIIRDIIYGVAARGVSINSLCEKSGIDINDLNDSEKKLNYIAAYKVWEQAVSLTNDQLLGLHLGEISNPSILGMVGHLMQTSATLGEAFENVSGFGRVATDMFKYSIKRKDDQYILTYEPSSLWIKASSNSARQATEQAMAGTLNVFFLLSGIKVIPVKVTFAHKRQQQLSEYERVFTSALQFNAVSNQLIFSLNQLERPVKSHDRSLHKIFSKILETKKKEKGVKKFSDQLKQIILADFSGQPPPIEILASHLSLGVRSMQRKLKSDRMSYRKLSASIKKELAIELLKGSDVKVSYVANVLGYSESSAFRRAYKTWTSSSPRKN